jgi:hypothetical protein
MKKKINQCQWGDNDMSRSGYTDDCDDILASGRWRGRVASATRGQRGQKLFKDLLAALDAMPEKRLISGKLKEVSRDGMGTKAEFCTLGVLGEKRGHNMLALDPDDTLECAKIFDIAEPLVQEIVYMNDEYFEWDQAGKLSPEDRWTKMREWVASQIKEVK